MYFSHLQKIPTTLDSFVPNQDTVDPRDLAIVRFTPSASDPHSDYADEFYFPAIEGGKMLPAPFRGDDKQDNTKVRIWDNISYKYNMENIYIYIYIYLSY